MIDNSFNKYKADIFNTEKFIPAEEQAYFEVYSKTKSIAIRDKIVKAYSRLVLHVVLKYKNAGVALEDLISSGYCGLIRAVELFDYKRGNRFMTFAIWWIRAAVQSAIEQDKNLIAIPWNKRIAINKAKKNVAKDDKLAKYESINKNIVSFESPAFDNSKNTIADVVKDENVFDVVAKVDTEHLIDNLLACCSNDEQQVMREIFGIGYDKQHTLREVASHMDCSHSRIKQLRDQALRRIKKYTAPQMLDCISECVA